MQDQVIIYMALAAGRSRIRTGEVTLHTHTAMHFSQLLTGVRTTCDFLGRITPLCALGEGAAVAVHAGWLMFAVWRVG